MPERTLLTLARDLRDRIEAIPAVLEARIVGTREELVEIVIDPIRRVSVSPALPFQQPAVAEWDWDTRGLAPGAYLVICTFKPHLDIGMVGSVIVE